LCEVAEIGNSELSSDFDDALVQSLLAHEQFLAYLLVAIALSHELDNPRSRSVRAGVRPGDKDSAAFTPSVLSRLWLATRLTASNVTVVKKDKETQYKVLRVWMVEADVP
jgi:hypothetical protein